MPPEIDERRDGRMRKRYNPPPNWPQPPKGWRPPPGWEPNPSWPAPPDGWQIWVDDRRSTGRPVVLTVLGLVGALFLFVLGVGTGGATSTGSSPTATVTRTTAVTKTATATAAGKATATRTVTKKPRTRTVTVTRTVRTRSSARTETTKGPSVQRGVHPGAFCSPRGAIGYTAKGTRMRCSTKPDDPYARWRSY